jgi:predicted ester cyclase
MSISDGVSPLERNKAVVRDYIAAFNRGDMVALRQIYAPDAVVHGVLGWGEMDKVIPIWEMLHSAFAIELTAEEMIAEGNEVAARYTERGTFQGAFRGNEPTGRSYERVAMEWLVLRDGKILKRWGARDSASRARQIGLPLD